MVRTTRSKKLTKKQKLKLEMLRAKQDPAFFLKERLKGLGKVGSTLAASFETGQLTSQLLDIGLATAGLLTFKDWKGALIGPVGLRLATAPAGLGIPVTQIAGLALLGYLGIGGGGGLGILQGGKGLRLDEEGRVISTDVQLVDKKAAEKAEAEGKTVRQVPWYPGVWTVED